MWGCVCKRRNWENGLRRDFERDCQRGERRGLSIEDASHLRMCISAALSFTLFVSHFHSRLLSLARMRVRSVARSHSLILSLALSLTFPHPPPSPWKHPHTLSFDLFFSSLFVCSLFLWLAGEVRGTQSFARFGGPPSVMAFCAGVFVSECIFACTCVCVCVCVYKHKHTHTHTLVWKMGPITNSWFVVYV